LPASRTNNIDINTSMKPEYHVADASQIISPAMVVFRDLVERNLDEMIRIAGGPERLRPHCKTHKMSSVTRLQLERGITKYKAATFAEAEMLATSGANNIFLAYNLVGPNIHRAVEFVSKFPAVTFFVTADHPEPIRSLGQAFSEAQKSIGVLLDLDTGQHRTGVEVGERARALYAQIADTPGLVPSGLHLYDGHNHQTDVSERRTAVLRGWEQTAGLRDDLVRAGLPVPRIVCGGTGSFPIFASLNDPAIELSPGTCVFHDWGYGNMFPDLPFTPAALLLTRVISCPTADRITLDLGYKAVASDPPAGNRVVFPDLPDARAVLQNEEHLVLETSRAREFAPGDELWGIPKHVCPTSALHKQVFVVSGGKLVERWSVDARDRWLSV
jgi:D-serine deaminase-like pyridoxal phosphate-dependent protein